MKLKRPPALRVGDTIALISPGARLDEARMKKTRTELQKLGFFVVEYPHKKKRSNAYFSASDEDRARELTWALKEPGVRGIFTCRGGYGSMRLLSHLNLPGKISPKIFAGYSDMTFLHQWMQNEKRILSFHAPLVGFLDRKDLKYFMSQMLSLPDSKSRENLSEAKILRGGKARGRLVGGNLSLLQTSGPGALPKEDLILAIEDVNENLYELDRIVWKLILAGYQKHVRGILLGKLTGCGKLDSKSFGLKTFYQSLLRLTKGPVLTNVQFGHGLKRQRVLALGANVELKGKTLFYREALVEARK